MNFITLKQLVEDTNNFASTLTSEYDFIIAIPRSGLIPGSILATRFGKPIASLTESGNLFLLAHSNKTISVEAFDNTKALLIDDSVHSYTSMKKVLKSIREASYTIDIQQAAIYGNSTTPKQVKIFKELSDPRIFEWNFMSHIFLIKACCDIDGVLCRDPTEEENDDGKKYINFCKTVKPLFCPTKKINTLVTARLEKYRDITEDWLKNNNVLYDKLVMSQYKTKEERMFNKDYGQRKAKVYASNDYMLFIESNIRQAEEIAFITKKPVLCTDRMVML